MNKRFSFAFEPGTDGDQLKLSTEEGAITLSADEFADLLADLNEATDERFRQFAADLGKVPYMVLLSPDHSTTLQRLYSEGKLNLLPIDDHFGNPDYHREMYGELEEALSTFVAASVEVQSDMADMPQVPRKRPLTKTA